MNVDPLIAAWGKHPIVLEDALETPLLDEQEYLDLLRSVGDTVRRLPKGAAMYDTAHTHYFNPDVPAAQPVRVVDEPFPSAADRSIEAYFERVSHQLGAGFCLVGYDLEQYSPVLWQRLAPLLDAIYAHVGHPPHLAHVHTFFGRYRATPVGVHRDTSHVLTFAIHGIKRLRCWPEELAAIDPDVVHQPRSYYERHLERSTLVEAGVRDLMYHPRSAWHVAENDELTASITVHWDECDNFYHDDLSVPRWAAGVVAERTAALPSTSPDPVRDALDRFAAAQHGPELVDAMWTRWLERTSRLSFRTLPAADSASLIPERTYRVAPGTLLQWFRARDGRVVCAGLGRSFALEHFGGIARVLDRIARAPWTLAELQAFAPELEPAHVERVAAACVRHGVVS